MRITLKATSEIAHLCDLCEALWYAGEDIMAETGHTLETYTQSNGREYTIEDEVEEDDEDMPVRYVDYK